MLVFCAGRRSPARYTSPVERSSFYLFGRLAGKQYRKAKWYWQSATGSEEDAIRAEHGVGRDMAAVVREQAGGAADPAAQAALDDVSAALAARVRNEAHRFEVTALPRGEATAYALPGGFIFVAPALVELAGGRRDELAFVVAHEMAHVMRRHAIDRLLGQKALSAVSLATPATRTIAPWLRTVGVRWLEKAHSREQEFEADELGARLMRAAGFDPAAAVRMLARLGSREPPDPLGLGAYVSTHPPVGERIRHLRERLGIAGEARPRAS